MARRVGEWWSGGDEEGTRYEGDHFVVIYMLVLGFVFALLTWDICYLAYHTSSFRTRDIVRQFLFDLAGYLLTVWNARVLYKTKGLVSKTAVILLLLLCGQLLLNLLARKHARYIHRFIYGWRRDLFAIFRSSCRFRCFDNASNSSIVGGSVFVVVGGSSSGLRAQERAELSY